VAGTETPALLLARLTSSPLLDAGALSVTVQLFVPDPEKEALLQDRPLSTPPAGVAAFNCRSKLTETLPVLAITATVCVYPTGDTVAVNPALVAFAGTVTVAGTKTAALLVDRLTLSPFFGAGAFSATVQASVPDPVMDALLQEIAPNSELRLWVDAPAAHPAEARVNMNRATHQRLSSPT
jgi:hypothetical protein